VILSSQPFSNDWTVLNLTWTRRFLNQATILKSDYEAVEKQVVYYSLFVIGSSCLLLSGLGVLAVIPSRVIVMVAPVYCRLDWSIGCHSNLTIATRVKKQSAYKSLKTYWKGIIYEREKMEAKQAHIIGSMKVYSKDAEHNAEKLTSEDYSNIFPLQSEHQKNEATGREDEMNLSQNQEIISDAENNPFLVSEYDKDEVLLRMFLVIKVPTICSRSVDRRYRITNQRKRGNEIEGNISHKKAKKNVESAPNTRPRNDSQKSSSSDVDLENEEIKFDFTVIEKELQQEPTNDWIVGSINVSQRFRQYQIGVLEKAKTNGLKWSDFYEILALSSIIAFSSSCPYPASIFTNREWQNITCENPYVVTDPVLPTEVMSSLRNASADCLEGKTIFLSVYDSEISQAVSRIFNAMCNSVPAVSPTKTSEDEHCFQLLHPVIRPLFFTSSNKEYKIRLNRATKDQTTWIYTSPTTKDKLKVQLRGRKSINQLLKMKGGPEEAILLINQGDLVKSYVMDLKYDGLYRSWPFLTTRLVKDKTTIPLLESNIRHFMALEEKCQEISDALQTIARLYEKACNAENETLKANQAETLCLYNYFKEFYYQNPSTELPDNQRSWHGQDSFNNSLDNLSETEMNKIIEEVSRNEDAIESESLPETETKVSISTESHVSDSSKAEVNVVPKKFSPENQMSVSASPPYENKTRPPISILPEDPKEKRKHGITMVLEKW
ncbi:7541_t:CDS:10, partial [Acaulospora morrowiae]